MSRDSGIEWTEHTWNPIRGCTRVSPGCGGPGPHGGCYAEAMAARFSKPGMWGHGIAEMKDGKPRWTGKVELQEDRITLPLKWRKPATIFVSSTSDVFHEALPDEAIDKIFAVMALCPQHTFQVLTKRAERMREYLSTSGVEDKIVEAIRAIGAAAELRSRSAPSSRRVMTADQIIDCDARATSFNLEHGYANWPLPNVWLGISAERQQEFNDRWPFLRDTPAAVRFISYEPALGRLDACEALGIWQRQHVSAAGNTFSWERSELSVPRPDWIICGGESGPNARPMHPDWARSIRDQCDAAGVSFFFQWGEYRPVEGARAALEHAFQGLPGTYIRVGKKSAGRLLDGRTYDGMPGK